MSDGQKTHAPTPKRVREFRKRGDIALSRDVVTAATFLGGSIALVATASTVFALVEHFTRDVAMSADGRDHGQQLASDAMHMFIRAVGPVVGLAAAAALLSIMAQLGWPPAWKGIGFDLGRANPLANLKNTFGLAGMFKRTGLALVKLAVVGTVVYTALRGGVGSQAMAPESLLDRAGSLIGRVLFAVAGTLAALAALDYFLSRRRISEQMKMSTDEIKREHKEQDGDPMLKGKRKARMRELAKRRVAQAVKTADVVVVNPTHFAVALRYDESKDRAPVVVAKGVDEAALKIRELAREAGVPVLSRPPLARALHKSVKEGRTIPSSLFKAVAEVLAFVYRTKRRAQ